MIFFNDSPQSHLGTPSLSTRREGAGVSRANGLNK